MKLELKHIIPYLEHGLKCQIDFKYTKYHQIPIIEVKGVSREEQKYDIGEQIEFIKNDDLDFRKFDSIRPILRPLSDLTKEIEHNGERFFPNDTLYDKFSYLYNGNSGEFSEWLIENLIDSDDYSDLPYGIIEKLFEWHFDVFGLIDNGLAIDKNTLE